MVVIDTSALVRFFTKDIVQDAIRVKKLLESGEMIHIPDAVFPELEYVLSKNYGLRREDILVKFKFLSANQNCLCHFYVERAVDYYARTNLDMADCLIASQAHETPCSLASFDKKLVNKTKTMSYW